MTPSSNAGPPPPVSVDELVTAFKRKGHFDTLRKSTLSSYQTSTGAQKLTSTLRELVRAEVEKDPHILSRDRSKSSILIGGAVDRARVIDTVEQDKEAIFKAQHTHDDVKTMLMTLLSELTESKTSNGTK